MAPKRSSKPKGKPYKPITTLKQLRGNLQWALSGELSAIPPYLCALYSIKDVRSDAYAAIRSVVIEEMLHMMQVANLLNAIGGCPSLGKNSVPRYPGYMLHHAVGGPRIELQKYSPELARRVFMAIEKPATSRKMPKKGAQFTTVGQFYQAVEQGFETCVEKLGEDTVFSPVRPQIKGTYFGSGGGRLVEVCCLKSVKRAIEEITEQGEGAFFPKPPRPGQEPFGAVEQYAIRKIDKTYGPILGRPWELSHFSKFKKLARKTRNSPDVYAMQINPSARKFAGLTKDLADLFNRVYTLMLGSLENLFRTGCEDWFFGVAFPMMRNALEPLAILLMQTPVDGRPGSSDGPTAGPPFAFDLVTDAQLLSFARRLASASSGIPGNAQSWWGTLGQVLDTLQKAVTARRALLKLD